MALTAPYIATVETGAWALPENDTRRQNVSVGQSASGAVKFYKFRTSDRLFTITLKRKSTSIKDALCTALEADADYKVEVHPADHIDCGGGAGVAIYAEWLDPEFRAVKVSHDAWDITLNFLYVSTV
jgi:hypothetical protein